MARRAGPALLARALAASVASAQTITRGPIIQNPAALPTTTTVLWWTNVVGDSTVEYGTTPALGSSVTVPTAASCEVGAAGTCHVVPLAGLLPGTRYYYRLLTDGVEVQAPGSYFTTLRGPADPSDLFFTVIGDWGQASAGEADVANLQDGDDPPLILTVGDNAYPNGTQSDWDDNALAYCASGLLTVSASAKNGAFPVAADRLPVRFTIVVEGPIGDDGQCGEATFFSPAAPRCVLSATGSTLKCR